MNWKHTIKLKHLITEKEDPESVDACMRAIAEVIKGDSWFSEFDTTDFYNCLEDDDPLDLANQLMDDLYNYADFKKIWIE
jgi:hypothetical protein